MTALCDDILQPDMYQRFEGNLRQLAAPNRQYLPASVTSQKTVIFTGTSHKICNEC